MQKNKYTNKLIDLPHPISSERTNIVLGSFQSDVFIHVCILLSNSIPLWK